MCPSQLQLCFSRVRGGNRLNLAKSNTAEYSSGFGLVMQCVLGAGASRVNVHILSVRYRYAHPSKAPWCHKWLGVHGHKVDQ